MENRKLIIKTQRFVVSYLYVTAHVLWRAYTKLLKVAIYCRSLQKSWERIKSITQSLKEWLF